MPNPTEYPRCRSCRWWNAPPDRWGIPSGGGKCQHRWIDPRQQKDVPMAYGQYDGSFVADEMVTSHDFGCILHQPKEPNNEQ